MISIVITSFNYARFLRACLESALAQRPACEVIVVDDGSTDESIRILDEYVPRITLIKKSNGGEASAMYEGFQCARYDTVIFLDSDDVLYAHCVESVVPYLSPDVSKVQFRLDTIDAYGNDQYLPFPHYTPRFSPEDVLSMVVDSGWYPTPVNTGVAYNRRYLEKVFPICDDRFRDNADGYLTILAPLYGQVVSVNKILGAYRVHGDNFWVNGNRKERFSMYTAHEIARQDQFVKHAARFQVTPAANALFNNMSHLEHRMLSLRLTPERHPVEGERRLPLFFRSVACSAACSYLR